MSGRMRGPQRQDRRKNRGRDPGRNLQSAQTRSGHHIENFGNFYVRPERANWVFKFNQPNVSVRCLAGRPPIRGNCKHWRKSCACSLHLHFC